MAVKTPVFVPIAGDSSLSGEFDSYQANSSHTFKEEDAADTWKGPPIKKFIKAEKDLPMVDLPKMLEYMIKHAWEKASVSAGATRGPVQIAGGRGAALNTLSNSKNPLDLLKAQRIKDQAASNVVAPAVSPNFMGSQAHLQGIAEDWKTMDELKRVNAYTFRGDRRNPIEIKAAGGFHPPNTRTDTAYVNGVIFPRFQAYMQRRYKVDVTQATFDQVYQGAANGEEERKVLRNYFTWRTLMDNEAYHAGRMLAREDLKGYISTTRATVIAKHFAKGNGWVFVTLVRGGFLIPDRGATEWTAVFGEQEIALPASVPWSEIFGFRQVEADGKIFTGPVYLRKDFKARNKDAFSQCGELLSGKNQSNTSSFSLW